MYLENTFGNSYSFIETYFLTNENSYGRFLSSRRHTNGHNLLFCCSDSC